MRSDLGERLEAFFHSRPSGAVAVYLFGSAARGEDTPASDADLAVLFDQLAPPSLTVANLHADLERHLVRPVDLIVLNHAPADLVHRVLRDGQIVLDRDPARRLRFEVAKRNEFFDLEPVRRRYRRAVRSHPAP